ncbi:MAG: hypothetical protein WCA06_20735, partial [Terrimicrobiaceae bacterium]
SALKAELLGRAMNTLGPNAPCHQSSGLDPIHPAVLKSRHSFSLVFAAGFARPTRNENAFSSFFRPKSRESENDIFRGFSARATGEFVIESDSPPDNGKPFEHYRCQRDFGCTLGCSRLNYIS